MCLLQERRCGITRTAYISSCQSCGPIDLCWTVVYPCSFWQVKLFRKEAGLQEDKVRVACDAQSIRSFVTYLVKRHDGSKRHVPKLHCTVVLRVCVYVCARGCFGEPVPQSTPSVCKDPAIEQLYDEVQKHFYVDPKTAGEKACDEQHDEQDECASEPDCVFDESDFDDEDLASQLGALQAAPSEDSGSGLGGSSESLHTGLTSHLEGLQLTPTNACSSQPPLQDGEELPQIPLEAAKQAKHDDKPPEEANESPQNDRAVDAAKETPKEEAPQDERPQETRKEIVLIEESPSPRKEGPSCKKQRRLVAQGDPAKLKRMQYLRPYLLKRCAVVCACFEALSFNCLT